MGSGVGGRPECGSQPHVSAPLEDWSPYEPLGVVARSGPPSARPSPERHSVWWRRMLPLLLSDKPAFFGSLGAALLSLIAAILIPRVTMDAIDDALIARTSSLAPYVWILLGLAVFRAILTYAYRTSLYGIAYRLEYDLRVIVFEHLTRMSFSFYDRVQSGQLISRANSDIRSVQMFLTFAPLVALNARQLRRRHRLDVHDPRAPDARRARHDAVRLRRWACGMRNQHVPALVDRAGAAGRRRDHRRRERQRRAGREGFAAEERQVDELAERGAAAAVGVGRADRRPGSLRRRSWRTCPGSASPQCCCTAGGSPSTARSRSARSSPSTPTSCMLQAPFRILGHDH